MSSPPSSSSSPSTTPLSTDTLRQVHAYWLGEARKHAPSAGSGDIDGAAELPREVMKRWFMGGEQVDRECRNQFGAHLEHIRASPPKEHALLDLVQEPNDAVGLVVLLDQMPRNVYRGKDARIAHEIFDPIAASVSRAFAERYQGEERTLWTGHYYNWMFLYMPLLHSENLADHDIHTKKQQYALETALSPKEREAIQTSIKFEDDHRKVIERFGRYPSRNECMGRESTPEELEFLKNGPGWGPA